MNEVTRIRLGRIAYDIDINAKKELERYSRAIRKSLGQDSDVYDDIEIRMTEILADQGIQAGEVITLNEVLAIESQLGQPGDFASDSNNSGAEADTDNSGNSEPHAKAAKKYYRDVDHALAGGVLAGLSAYTGIDVTILRLIFVGLCFISFGTFFLVYIIVWMVAPPALTVGEKLEMRGEPVDLASIIEESSARLGDEIGRAGRNVKERVQSLKVDSPTTTNNSIGVRIARILSGLAGALLLLFTIFASFIGLVTCTVAILSSIGVHGGLVPTIIAILTLLCGISFAICLTVISLCLLSFRYSKRAGLVIIASFAISAALFVIITLTSISWVGFNSHDAVTNTTQEIVTNARDKFGSIHFF